ATRIKGRFPGLPREEQILFDGLIKGHLRTGNTVTMLDGHVIVALEKMAASLRKEVLGKWLLENRQYVRVGISLSVLAMVVAAGPRYRDDWMVLALSFLFMIPGVFYMYYVVLRLRDLY